MTAAQTGTAVAPNGVDLVNKNNAGRLLLRLLKHVADAGRAHPHKHLYKIGARYGEKWHFGFTGDRLGQ